MFVYILCVPMGGRMLHFNQKAKNWPNIYGQTRPKSLETFLYTQPHNTTHFSRAQQSHTISHNTIHITQPVLQTTMSHHTYWCHWSQMLQYQMEFLMMNQTFFLIEAKNRKWPKLAVPVMMACVLSKIVFYLSTNCLQTTHQYVLCFVIATSAVIGQLF